MVDFLFALPFTKASSRATILMTVAVSFFMF